MGKFGRGALLALTLAVLAFVFSPSQAGGPSGAGAAVRAVASATGGPVGEGEAAGSEGSPAAADELLVKFRPHSGFAVALANKIVGSEEIGRIESLGVMRVRVGQALPLSEAQRYYEALPQVEYAEPNYRLRAAETPDDPLYVAQQQTYYDLIEAPDAWDIELGDPSVVVAILDTGVDVSHADLRDQIRQNDGEVAGNGIDDDGNGCVDDVFGCNFVDPDNADPSCEPGLATPNNRIEDDEGHGTFVAGVVGAGTNNSLGVAGGARGVSLLPVKVLDCTGAGTVADVAAGVMYAARMGASVINLSFGGEEDSVTLQDAITKANDLFGIVLVAPTGNEGTQGVFYPARYREVMAVAASGLNSPDAKASFSNWGPGVDVAAPGVQIVSTVPFALCGKGWTCIGGQPYAPSSGSSYAAAHVSALAALMLSINSLLTPEQVRQIMRGTALRLPDGPNLNWDGAGRIRMSRALSYVPFSIGVAGVTKS